MSGEISRQDDFEYSSAIESNPWFKHETKFERGRNEVNFGSEQVSLSSTGNRLHPNHWIHTYYRDSCSRNLYQTRI